MTRMLSIFAVLCLLASCNSPKKPGEKIGFAGENDTIFEHLRVKECLVLPDSGTPPHFRVVLANGGSASMKITVIPWFYTDRGARLLYPNENLTRRIETEIPAGEERVLEAAAPFHSAKSVKLEALR